MYLTCGHWLTLHSGLDLNDLYEWEGLVGLFHQFEWFTVQRGEIKMNVMSFTWTFDSSVRR